MPGELPPEVPKGGWTLATYAAHNEALRHAEQKLQEERDRRYAEVAKEREKAQRIKEEADRTALGLQRETQTYKDEKANELRSQIERERGTYVTQAELRGLADKIDASLKPIHDFISQNQGKQVGVQLTSGMVFAILAAVVAIGGLVFAFLTQ